MLSGAGPLPDGLCLRNLRPGDRLHIRGVRRKLQDVLTDSKLARPLRRRLPLLAVGEHGGDVLWAATLAGCPGLAGWAIDFLPPGHHSADGGSP